MNHHVFCLLVVEGSVPEVTELLKHSWGKIVFTGSEQVGKIVAQAAAKTLTPTLLELGGKCPCIVDETAPSDMQGMATRIIWGKTFNAGQTVRDCALCGCCFRLCPFSNSALTLMLHPRPTSALHPTILCVMKSMSMLSVRSSSRPWKCTSRREAMVPILSLCRLLLSTLTL